MPETTSLLGVTSQCFVSLLLTRHLSMICALVQGGIEERSSSVFSVDLVLFRRVQRQNPAQPMKRFLVTKLGSVVR